MARIEYADVNAEPLKELRERIVAERGQMLHIYRMLLNSPAVAEGWLAMMTAIRQRCALPGDLRELIIIRIAILNGAKYEAEQHVPFALREGVTRNQLAALEDWRASALFSPLQQTVLDYTDAMTRDVKVPAEVFAGLRRQFDNQGIVELTATIASYNMVSRFLVALGIEGNDEV